MAKTIGRVTWPVIAPVQLAPRWCIDD